MSDGASCYYSNELVKFVTRNKYYEQSRILNHPTGDLKKASFMFDVSFSFQWVERQLTPDLQQGRMRSVLSRTQQTPQCWALELHTGHLGSWTAPAGRTMRLRGGQWFWGTSYHTAPRWCRGMSSVLTAEAQAEASSSLPPTSQPSPHDDKESAHYYWRKDRVNEVSEDHFPDEWTGILFMQRRFLDILCNSANGIMLFLARRSRFETIIC